MAHDLLSAYLVVGANELKRNLTIQRLKARLGTGEMLSFNLCEYDAAEGIDVQELWSQLNQWGFDESLRGVFVYNADKLNKEAADLIVEYLNNPNPEMVVLLIADKMDKRKLLYKTVSSLAPSALIDCKQPDDKELASLTQKLARSYDIQLVGQAAQELVERVGSSTLQIDNQLQQLARLFAAQKNQQTTSGPTLIGVQQIREQVPRTAEAKPWPLLDAICARSFSLAAEELARFDISSAVYGLHALILRRIRELICVKSFAEKGQVMQAAVELNKQEWLINKYANWSRAWTIEELGEALIGGVACERALKGSGDSETAFICWVADMCGASS